MTSPSSTRPLAVVTGASSGIGYELAAQFAAHRFDVAIVADDPGIHEAARRLGEQGATVVAEQADLADPHGVRRFADVVSELHRPVAAAALNAGVGVSGPFHQVDLEADLRLVRLNVESTVHLAKLLLRDMVARGEGRLLFTSSVAATMPGPYYATYAASKAFVHSFAEALRHELKDTGVTVTSLMPGPTDTEFFERADMQDTRVAKGPKDDAAEVAKDGFDALMAGEDKVIAGSKRNVVQARAATVLPDTAKAAGHAKMTEPSGGTP